MLVTSARDYSVRIEPYGRTVSVGEGRSVLEAALAAGLNLPHSCRLGHCASCKARLVSGEIHYPHGRTAGITAKEAEQGYVLLCQARPRSDLTVEARVVVNASEAEIKTLPCRIASLSLLAPDVMQVFLRLPAVEPLQFRAGQYLDVLLESGGRRSFSIASPPHDSEQIELHVRRVPGGQFTDSLFERLRAGSLLKIEGPIGQFIYRDSDAPALMIAGGTGFAPLKSMLRHALEGGSKRRFKVYWGARQGVDLYDEAWLVAMARQYPSQLEATAVLSDVSLEQAHAGLHGRTGALPRRVGWVHEAVLESLPSLADYDVYAAGPPALIEAIRATFPARGVSDERLHFDSFDYSPV
jgi:CDP-4-dehydro-6-deoxyglucose reductase